MVKLAQALFFQQCFRQFSHFPLTRLKPPLGECLDLGIDISQRIFRLFCFSHLASKNIPDIAAALHIALELQEPAIRNGDVLDDSAEQRTQQVWYK
jgi:hypothetical protein